MKEFTITKAEEGQTLFKYLCKLLPQAPASLFHKSFRKKNITWNDKKMHGKRNSPGKRQYKNMVLR